MLVTRPPINNGKLEKLHHFSTTRRDTLFAILNTALV